MVPDTVSVAVKLWLPFSKVAVAKLQAPVAFGRRRAEQCRAVEEVHRAARRSRAGQRQHVGIGDAVADHAAVGRERGDGRSAGRRLPGQ